MGAASGAEPAETRATHTVGGGHEAQDIASRAAAGGQGRLKKGDEAPDWDRTPGSGNNARS